MKTCTKCKQTKPHDQYTRFCHARDGLSPWCKDCARQRNRVEFQRRQAARAKRDEQELTRLYPTKICSQCQKECPRSQFHQAAASKDGVGPECKDCTRERNRDYRNKNRESLKAKKKADYQADREGHLAKTRAWAHANPERHQYLQRRSHLKNMYNITPQQYDAMLERQGGVCAICKESSAHRLHVDHDHGCCPGNRTCGECVRGLLCGPCNRLLGWFETKRGAFEDYINRGSRPWQS